jgi:hypothetical protein
MASPDAEDASPSPEYRSDIDDDMAAEQKTDDGSPPQKSSNGQKPASNSKDPLRPRRKKARRACFACQRAHLTCGEYDSVFPDTREFFFRLHLVVSVTVLSDSNRRRATM